MRVGGGIRPPAKTRDATPVYPAIAQAARVEGTVILEALLNESGRVQNLRVLRAHPMLGVQILRSMKPISANKWEGEVYDARSGKIYSANMTLVGDNTLRWTIGPRPACAAGQWWWDGFSVKGVEIQLDP